MNVVESVAQPAATSPEKDGILQRRRMSFEEFLAWEPEGGLTEWVNGEAVQYMSATSTHQRVIQFLVQLMSYFVQLHRLGKVFTGPYAMHAKSGGNAREPDVFFVSNNHLANARETYLDGPANLVVEVVSDDSVNRDRVEKFDEYEAAGIREYWVIDPRPHRKRADFFVLNAEGRYQQVVVSDGVYRSNVLPDLWLKVDWLWEDDANVLTALANIVGADALSEALRQS